MANDTRTDLLPTVLRLLDLAEEDRRKHEFPQHLQAYALTAAAGIATADAVAAQAAQRDRPVTVAEADRLIDVFREGFLGQLFVVHGRQASHELKAVAAGAAGSA